MTWKKICQAEDVPVDTVKAFNIAGMALVVARYGEDGFRVLPPVCPHMEEPLSESGAIADCVLTCTKHLWAWDLRTLEKEGSETEKPLQSYDTKREGGAIFAFIEKEIVYDFEEEGEDDDDDFFAKS